MQLPIKDLPPGQIQARNFLSFGRERCMHMMAFGILTPRWAMQDLWLDLGPPERHNAAKNPVGAGIRVRFMPLLLAPGCPLKAAYCTEQLSCRVHAGVCLSMGRPRSMQLQF